MRRVPTVIQFASAECGHACARMMLAAYGRDVSIGELRRVLPVGRDGTSLQSVADLLASFGLETRVRSLPDLGVRVRTPAVLYWNHSHFVVLTSMTPRGAIIVDPSVGRLRMSLQELRRGYSGVCAVVTADRGEISTRRRASTRPALPVDALALVGSSLGGAVVGILPVTVSLLWALDRIGVLLGVLALAVSVVVVVAARLFAARASVAAHRAAGASLLEHLLRLPMAYFDARSPGELAARVARIDTARDVILSDRHGAAAAIGMVAGALAAMLMTSATTLWPVVAAAVLVMVVARAGIVAARLPAAAEAAHLRGATGVVARAVQSILSVKTQALEKRETAEWAMAYERVIAHRLRVRVIDALLRVLRCCIIVAAPIAVLLLITEPAPTNFAAAAAALILVAAAADLAERVIRLRALRHDADDVADILDEAPDVAAAEAIERIDGADLCAIGVSFRHPGAPEYTLQGIDLCVRRGRSVALIGESGAGKSTLVQILTGLRPATAGRVVADVGARIGYVPQHPVLIDGSIRSNITLDDEDVTESTLHDAVRAVGLDTMFDAMPMGIDTPVTTSAATLSGGERQRIALAQALVRRPTILILDEATSALDSAAEQRVLAECAMRVPTRIHVTHSRAIANGVDDVFEIEAGRIRRLTPVDVRAGSRTEA